MAITTTVILVIKIEQCEHIPLFVSRLSALGKGQPEGQGYIPAWQYKAGVTHMKHNHHHIIKYDLY